MYRSIKIACIFIFAISLILSSCSYSENDPKALAKETHSAFQKVKEKYSEGALGYLEWAIADTDDVKKLSEKIDRLSDKDHQTYNEELAKLFDF